MTAPDARLALADDPVTILRGWAKAYRDNPQCRFPSDPNAEFFPVDLEAAANEIAALRAHSQPVIDRSREAVEKLIQRHASAYVARGSAISDGITAECIASREALLGAYSFLPASSDKMREAILEQVIRDSIESLERNSTSAPVVECLKAALEFYADPFAWKKQNDPEDVVQIPDFYSETSFGDTALEALACFPAFTADDGALRALAPSRNTGEAGR